MYVAAFDNEECPRTHDKGGLLSLSSTDFRYLRMFLRIFGFWCPRRASFEERVLYPFIVNLTFLSILIIDIYNLLNDIFEKQKHFSDLTLETTTSLSRYSWAWIAHILLVRYFRKRSLEKNMLGIEIQRRHRHEVKNVLTQLNIMLGGCIFVAVSCTCLSFVAGIYLHYPSKWKFVARKTTVNGTIKKSMGEPVLGKARIILISLNDLYLVPTVMCLTFLMYLLYHTSNFRLHCLQHDFAHWKQTAEAAVFRHYAYYDSKVQSTCEELQALFVSHNVFMVVLTPQFFYLCVEIGRKNGIFDLAIFLYYLLFTYMCWLIPLYYAEGMKSIEGLFCNEINRYCPGYLELKYEYEEQETVASLTTFRARREVTKLVSYLTGRKTGFLIGGYSFHMQLSMLSFYLGLLTFVVKVMS